MAPSCRSGSPFELSVVEVHAKQAISCGTPFDFAQDERYAQGWERA